ncbi:MAG: acetate--CoA ligase family protein [Hyphomicrobiales bacterium]|nr:acetate--CoA ligase family protein [Hyphomicrobiales bacterium]
MLVHKAHRLTDPAALRQKLLSPRSIALIGASDDPTKNAARPLTFLRRGGYAGTIYPINPRRNTVLGERAWPSVEALPEVPDHAYVLVPTEAVVEAVAQCGRFGVPLVTVLADGFATAGGVGAARSAQLKQVTEETGVRVIGPSSLGVIDFRARLMLTANASFGEPDWPVGRVLAASHSGSIIGALAARGKARGIGFAALVSAGLEVDLGIGEICAATLDDSGIDGYLLFLETIRQADALRSFAQGAAARGRPVVAYKLGRSAEARELAVTHSGALAGEDDVADAFFAACGIARVDTFEGLIEATPLLRRVPPRARERAPRVGVVTTTGGAAAMVVDCLAVRGIHVEAPSQQTLAKLAAAKVTVEPGLIVDLTLAGARYEIMKAALDTLLAAPEFDLVVAVVGSSARLNPNLAVRPIADCAYGERPLAAFVAPDAPEAFALLTAAGVANFRTPESCADAVAAALTRRAPVPWSPAPAPAPGKPRALDELAAYALLDRLGVPRAPALALDASTTAPPVLPFAYPVAAKALAADIAHKTDVGGVALNIPDGPALVRAVATLRENVRRHRGTRVERVLVQPMVAGVGEVLIAYRVEPEVGPLVMLAMGGVFTEIYRDRVLRLAPIDRAAAREMIGELKGIRALSGFRGQPPGDLDALAHALAALSQLAADPTVVEAEVNPLIVRAQGQGVTAVDALVLRTASAEQTNG